MLAIGALVIACTAVIAGASGFGLGLLATPCLLLAGFSLPFVVTLNLLTTFATRISVAYRFRHDLCWRRALTLIAASVPGLYIGARMISEIGGATIKLVAGVLVVLSAIALLLGRNELGYARSRGAAAAAGFLGGFLGTAASLNGVAPALLLTHERVKTSSFFADLAAYAIGSAGIGLALLAATGGLSGRALFPAFVLSLPGALVGNLLGTALGLRLPQRHFRTLTLGTALVAGLATVANSAA